MGTPEVRSIIQVSCPASADGPSSVMILSEPGSNNGILPAEIGSQVEMVCVFNGAPESKYRWIHNGSLLSISEKITLPSLTWDQMGRYRCIVENNLTQLTLYEEVQVQHPRECSSSLLLSPNLPTSVPLPRQCLSSGMPSLPCVAMLTIVGGEAPHPSRSES